MSNINLNIIRLQLFQTPFLYLLHYIDCSFFTLFYGFFSPQKIPTFTEKREKAIADIGGEKKEIGWGSQIRSYVFQPYTLVKDNRTKVEIGNVQAVMDGEIDAFIEAKLRGKVRVKGAKDEDD